MVKPRAIIREDAYPVVVAGARELLYQLDAVCGKQVAYGTVLLAGHPEHVYRTMKEPGFEHRSYEQRALEFFIDGYIHRSL
jgi:hypothetical protein